MGTYLSTANYAKVGMQRRAALTEPVEAAGTTIESLCHAFGECDSPHRRYSRPRDRNCRSPHVSITVLIPPETGGEATRQVHDLPEHQEHGSYVTRVELPSSKVDAFS